MRTIKSGIERFNEIHGITFSQKSCSIGTNARAKILRYRHIYTFTPEYTLGD